MLSLLFIIGWLPIGMCVLALATSHLSDDELDEFFAGTRVSILVNSLLVIFWPVVLLIVLVAEAARVCSRIKRGLYDR